MSNQMELCKGKLEVSASSYKMWGSGSK